jgi:hypothetical protein
MVHVMRFQIWCSILKSRHRLVV